MKFKGYIFVGVCIIALYCIDIGAIIIGSDTVVSRQSFFTFPAADADNEIRGFAFMGSGFALEDNTTTCTYNGIFPVRTTMQLNDGSLFLLEDLMLDHIENLSSWGHVIANGHFVTFPTVLESLGSTSSSITYTAQDVILELQSTTSLLSPMLFRGDSTLRGIGNTLDLGSTGSILVDSDSTLHIRDVEIKNVQDQNIRCVDDSAKLILENVSLAQSANATFANGSILFKDLTNIQGTYTFFYTSAQTSTIESQSKLQFTDKMILNTGRSAISGAQPINFVDLTSILALKDAGLITSSLGLQITKGTVLFDRNVFLQMNSTSTANGLILGDGTSAGDAVFKWTPAAIIFFNAGHFVYNDLDPNGLQSAAKTARFYRNPGSQTFLQQSAIFRDIAVEFANATVAPIQIFPGRTLRLENILITLPGFEADVRVFLTTPPGFLLNGNDLVFATKGSVPLPLTINSTGNFLLGNGSFAGPITFQTSASNLSWQVNGVLNAAMNLNGGTLNLLGDMVLGSGIVLVGPGITSLNNRTLRTGVVDLTWTTSMLFSGSNGEIDLNSNLSLSQTWTFNGTTTIDGLGHTLTMLTGGNIVVNNGATVKFKNIILSNINGTNIRCVDNTGQVSLEDVMWQQSNNFVFSNGAMIFKGQNTLEGENFLFVYDSTQTSTIQAMSKVTLDESLTFSYHPANNSPTLLQFVDETSQLILDGGTLHAGNDSGLNVRKGTITIRTDSRMSAQLPENALPGTSGITLGNDNASDDMRFIISEGVELYFAQGALNYRNVIIDSWQTINPYSHLTMATGTRLDLFQDLVIGNGEIFFEDMTVIGRAVGKDLFGSIVPLGNLFYESI